MTILNTWKPPRVLSRKCRGIAGQEPSLTGPRSALERRKRLARPHPNANGAGHLAFAEMSEHQPPQDQSASFQPARFHIAGFDEKERC